MSTKHSRSDPPAVHRDRAGWWMGIVIASCLASTATAQRPELDQPERFSELLFTRPDWHLEFLFSAQSPQLNLRSMDGLGIVHTWTSPPGWAFGQLSKPLPSGNILAQLAKVTASNTRKVAELDWAGNVVWEFVPPPSQEVHHDFVRLANGNTQLVVKESVVVPVLSALPVQNNFIREVDRQGATVWEWSCAANIAQLPISASGWSTLIAQSGPNPPVFWINSLQSLPENRWAATDTRFKPGNLLVSFRAINLVAIIERSTGQIVWSIVNQTIAQHHASMIPVGLPGAGNILLFDNGGFGGAPPIFRGSSRAIELDPTSSQIVWQYTGNPPIFSRFMGSVQRLANGNTVIGYGAGGVREVTAAGALVWFRPTPQIYRAYRISGKWPTQATGAFAW